MTFSEIERVLTHCPHLTNFWLFLRVGEFCLFVLLTSSIEHKRLRSEKEIKKCGKNVAISAMNTAKISLIQDEAEKLVLCCFLLEIRELKW